MNLSDQDILVAIREGRDSEAVGSLYKSVLPNVRKHIIGNGGSEDDAFDIFQDALLSLFKLVITQKYDSEKYKLHGFLYTLSKNLWINKTRKQARALKWEKSISKEAIEEPYLQVMLDEERKRTLDAVFQTLGEKCIQLLTLFIYNKLSMKEIAVKLNMSSEDAVKVKMYRCRKMLSQKVKADKSLLEQLRN